MQWLLVVLATLISVFLYALDNTVVADIVPVIVNDFKSVSELPWLSVGFALGGIALAMLFGKLFGLFDAKWLYISCVVLFMGASALCGGAPNMDAEIVGRVLAGAGGNGMYLGVLTLLSVNTSDTERPVYLSLVGVFFGVGTVLGPLVGGGFEKYTWRWALWVSQRVPSEILLIFLSSYIIVLLAGVFLPIMVFLIPNFDPAKVCCLFGIHATAAQSADDNVIPGIVSTRSPEKDRLAWTTVQLGRYRMLGRRYQLWWHAVRPPTR